MMNSSKSINETIQIREMRKEEAEAVQQCAKKVFGFPASIIIPKPKHAAVAVKDGCILGGAIYSYHNAKDKTFGYLDWGFMSKESRGLGLGKRTYRMAIEQMQEKCDFITCSIHFENTNSFRALRDNDDFNKTTYINIIKNIGFFGLIKFLFSTGVAFAIGHDLWVNDSSTKEYKESGNVLMYFVLNILLLFGFLMITPFRYSYIDVQYSNIVVVCIAMLIAQFSGSFIFSRFTRCDMELVVPRFGLMTNFFVSFNGFPLFSNARWVLKGYKWSVREYKKELAIPIIGSLMGLWLVVFISFFVPFMQSKVITNIFMLLLALNSLPFLPSYVFYAKGIYRYSKWLYLCTLLINTLLIISLILI